jgi:hypothetical protein
MPDRPSALQPALETVKVRIMEVPPTADNPSGIVVEPDLFAVSRAKDTSKSQVEWICVSSGFIVEFKNEAPFTESRFTRSNPGSVLSGPVRNNVQSDDHLPHESRKNYQYTVRIGSRVLDPGGVVDR